MVLLLISTISTRLLPRKNIRISLRPGNHYAITAPGQLRRPGDPLASECGCRELEITPNTGYKVIT